MKERSCMARALGRLMWASVLLGCTVGAQGQSTPSITGLSVPSGPVGTSVTIRGVNFGASQGLTSTVTFNGIVAAGRGRPATSWSSTSIILAVPGGATAGNVVVTVGGVASNGVNFAVIPVIQSVSPVSGLAGTVVTVMGTGFGNSVAQGSSTVTFNGLAVAPSTWGSTSFTVAAPAGVSAGKVVATVGGQVSNGVLFTPTPIINSVSPTAGGSGTVVTISGSNFGNAQGTVSFNGVAAASITSWSNLSITATVPSSTTTGNVVVGVNGVFSNGVTFTLTPAISGLSPNPVLANELVTISGSNFGSSSIAGTVTFNGIPGTPTSWSNTSIGILVPGNATAGRVVVTVNGAASNGVAYTLVSPYSFSLSYAPNSDVLTANDSVNGNWTYTYDDFNRLATANNSSPLQGLSYLYDSYGNRWQQTVTAGTGGRAIFTFSGSATATSTGNCYHAAGLTNQLDGYCYDAAGNLLNDGQHSYTYDAENQIVSVDNGQTAVYTYEGSGQRIRKVSGTQTVDYLYDLNGHVITELNTFGGWNRTEIYAGGRHLATYNNGTTYFAQSDWLGSERVHSLPSGAPAEICSNLPFGDGLSCTGSIDASPNHFTGKERDQESGLDYFEARYDASALGRFMTPDPLGGHLVDPQSLNQYSYVRNLPTSLTDPTGLDFNLQCSGNSKTCQGGKTGTTSTDANGNKTFTATVISNDKNGNLVDQNGKDYSAQVNASGVQFTQNGGNTPSNGSWISGSNATSFNQSAGALAGFSFTFSEPGKTQTLAGTFTYSGTRDEAKTALGKAGFSHSIIDQFLNPLHGFNVTHYRGGGDPRTGRGSAHFILDPDFVSDDGVVFDLPKVGNFHYGEVDPRVDFPTHFKEDVIPFVKSTVPH
jgi:RHS repeat-associated protein